MISKRWIPILAVAGILLVGLVLLGIGFFSGDDTDTGPERQPTQSSNP